MVSRSGQGCSPWVVVWWRLPLQVTVMAWVHPAVWMEAMRPVVVRVMGTLSPTPRVLVVVGMAVSSVSG